MTEEVVPLPVRGRVFDGRASAGLGDVTPAGRARLDTLARWLQDVAFDDVRDAGLSETGIWVIRKSRLLVRRFPTLREEVALQTFCSGIGPRWAERRTVLRGQGGAEVESVAIWVHLDPATGAPSRLVERYAELYGEAAAGRGANGRLRL
ncbi:MAG TPA: acyl-ACP thioesterase domain-containing protein, partial [Capillimicrobium sp.]